MSRAVPATTHAAAVDNSGEPPGQTPNPSTSDRGLFIARATELLQREHSLLPHRAAELADAMAAQLAARVCGRYAAWEVLFCSEVGGHKRYPHRCTMVLEQLGVMPPSREVPGGRS